MRTELLEYLLFQNKYKETLLFSNLFSYKKPEELIKISEMVFKMTNSHFKRILIKTYERMIFYAKNTKKENTNLYKLLLKLHKKMKSEIEIEK